MAVGGTAAAQNTPCNLVNALGIPAEQVLSHFLLAEVDNGTDRIALPDNETALFASCDPLQDAVLLATGRAADEGQGSTAYLADNATDELSFYLKLAVPSGKKSLMFTTQFITSEYTAGGARSNDNASLEISINDAAVAWSPLAMGSAAESTGSVNPLVTRAINVAGKTNIELTFIVRDRGDALYDSALRLMRVYFSDQAVSGAYTENPTPQDVKLPEGCYASTEILIKVPGVADGMHFIFSLSYNSCFINPSFIPVGSKWSHSYDWFVKEVGNGIMQVKRGDGGSEYFDPSGSGYVPKYKGFYNSLVKSHGGQANAISYTYETKQHLKYRFSWADGVAGQYRLTAITDANYNTIALSYDPSSKKLSTVQDTRGNTAHFTYGANGKLASVTYNSLLTVSFTYSGDNLASYTDANGHTTSFTYDGSSHLLTGTNGDGIVFVENTYTGDRIDEQANARGAVSGYLYIEDDVVFSDFMGHLHTSTYDTENRLVQKADPLNVQESFIYDDNSNVQSITDPLTGVTGMTYDSAGNMLTLTNALGHTRTMTYDGNNNLLSKTDELGNSSAFEYDASNNPIKNRDPLGHLLQYSYTGKGQVQQVADPNGNTVRYTYTPQGDMASAQDPDGGVIFLAHDDLGRQKSVTDQNGNTTWYTYDNAGNVLTKTDPTGNTISYTYNAEGKPLTIAGLHGIMTRYTYTPTGKEHTITDALNNTVSFEYNAADLPTASIDPLGRATQFDYDEAGRLKTVTDALGSDTATAYDEAGNILAITDPNGNTTRYTYDLLGHITSETDPLNNQATSSYDAVGRVAEITSPAGRTISYGYDAAGRITDVELQHYTVTHTLDGNGNQLETKGEDNATIQRTFDRQNRLISRTDQFGKTIMFSYDAVGNLKTLTYSDGKAVAYAYDRANRLIQVTDWDNNTTRYTYDESGNLTQKLLPDGSAVHFYYDDAENLKGISDIAPDSSLVYSTRYTLNEVGLCVAEQATLPLYPAFEELEEDFTYNEANQLIQKGFDLFAYDEDGNLISGQVGGTEKELVFDELNQLVAVGDDSYQYDAEGLRIASTTNGATKRYVQCPVKPFSLLLEEHNEEGQITARYVYGADLISREDADGTVSVYHFDRRGSTVALTNRGGSITDRYAYNPYGKIVGRAGSTPNCFTYCGSSGVIDDGNGLYCMRARYYDPTLMRFIQKDQVKSGKLSDPQTLNRYAYARGNPITFIDPRGESVIGNFVSSFAKGFLKDLILHGELPDDWRDFTAIGTEALIAAVAGAVIASFVTVFSGAPIIGLAVFGVMMAIEAIFDIDIGKAIVSGIESMANWFKNDFVNFWKDVGNMFADIGNAIADAFVNFGNDVANWFKNDFVNFWVDDVGGFFSDVGEAICDFFDWLF